MGKFFAGIAAALILIAAIGSAFYFGTQHNKPQPPASPPPTPAATPSAKPTATAPETKTVAGGGILSFPKYKLTVPITWSDTREIPGPDSEKLILKKDSYQISILEGGFGGAICLFPGDPDSEGPSGRYDTFVDLTTKAGNIFRRVGVKGTTPGFGVCEKTQYGWNAPTSYGHISIAVPVNASLETLAEIDAILSSFEK